MTRYCLTSYDRDLVILDVLNDEFSLVPGAGELLEDKETLLRAYPQLSDYFENEYFIGSITGNKNDSFLEERWFLPEPDRTSYKLNLLKRLVLLSKILYYSKNIEKNGMGWIFRREHNKNCGDRLRSRDEEYLIREELSRVSIMFLMNIFKADCLTYSYTLKKMLNARHVDARLVIGVRTQPFYSHSWVEVDGKIVNDDPFLRDKLSVIAEI